MPRWIIRLLAFAALSQLFVATAWADLGGCEESPENPTMILGILGAAAAGLPWVKAQFAARRARRNGLDQA